MTPLEALLRSEALAFSLATARIAGMIATAPLAWSVAPLRVRAGLTLLLAFFVHGASSGSRPRPELIGELDLALAMTTEVVVGVAFGFVVRFALMVGELIGDVVTPVVGLGAAQIFDPHSRVSSGVLTTLLRHFAILIALVTGLHRVVLAGLLSSFEVLPAGGLWDPGRAAPTLLVLSAELFASAIRIALPVLGVIFVTQLALAFVARAAPAVQIFNVGFGITLGVGALILVLVLPDVGHQLAAEFSHVPARLERLLLELGARR
ncbi:MAG TPA: flagellar biosynthetic protein FliR [Polyangiaceae bacterium]|nr:flagellar biosynthetic protein FliR [Polyangiaceae bacterium]